VQRARRSSNLLTARSVDVLHELKQRQPLQLLATGDTCMQANIDNVGGAAAASGNAGTCCRRQSLHPPLVRLDALEVEHDAAQLQLLPEQRLHDATHSTSQTAERVAQPRAAQSTA
jgi:hypothetical protein